MLVVDASVLVVALVDDAPAGDEARARLSRQRLVWPELADLEVLSVLRRQWLSGRLSERRSQQAVADLSAMPAARVSHRLLVDRCWELRDNVSVYDAAYVALAEGLGCGLLTADLRLASAPGLRCPVEVLQD